MVLGPDNPHSSVKALLFIVVLHQIKHIYCPLKFITCSFCKEQMFKKPACPGDGTIWYDTGEAAALYSSLSLLEPVNFVC